MIPSFLYQTVFLYFIIILTVIVSLQLSGQSYNRIVKGNNSFVFAFILCGALALWIGMRPLSVAFGDTYFYAHTYNLMSDNIYVVNPDSSEWMWEQFTYVCSRVMDVSGYFTIIAFGYFGFSYIACQTLTRNNVLCSFLFVLGAFSFYSYGTNGIRNGLACSMVLASIGFLATSRKKLYLGLILAFIAVNIHRSTLLPIVALFASIYVVKSFKWAYTFWILSILISLVAGGAISSIFAGMGFDDRLSYISEGSDGQYTKMGFRWDFLIYSMMPIILGYYVVIKRGIQNRTYLILLNTYTLANAFWVMVIRASYSNRFAYLSWFMYPIVLAYPLLKLDIWGDQQGKRTAQIMLAHVGFTWFMVTSM